MASEPKNREKMMVCEFFRYECYLNQIRLHEILMDMITEHNYGVPIPLNKENDASHMEDIHTEMLKRLVIFLALPAMILFSSIIWLTYDWPGIVKAIIDNRRRKLRRKFKNVNASFRLTQGLPIAQTVLFYD